MIGETKRFFIDLGLAITITCAFSLSAVIILGITGHIPVEVKKMDDKNRPELTDLTPAEIARNPELFHWNGYYRLTGQWFIPLPCHFWDLKKGMEIEILKIEDGIEKKRILTFDSRLSMDSFFAFLGENSHQYFTFREIKKMRILSFEVRK